MKTKGSGESPNRPERSRTVLGEEISGAGSELANVNEALRESERRFRAIFNQIYQFVGLLKPDGTLLEANQTALAFIGRKLSDVVGRPFWETPWWDVSPDVQKRLKDTIAEAAKGNFVRYETEHRRGDGTVSTFDFSLKPVFDESGRVVLIIPEGRDITSRKEAEEALRKAHDELEIRVRERTADLAKTNEALRAEILERTRFEGELATRRRELRALNRISEMTLSADFTDTPFHAIAEEISAATAFPQVAIELYDEARQKMVFKGIKGISLPAGENGLEVPVDETLSGIVARSGQPMVETNAWERSEYANEFLRKQGCRTFVCVPMRSNKGLIGVLSLASPEAVRVDDGFLHMATELANHVASLIERKRAETWLERLIHTTQDAVISIDRHGRVVLFNPAAEAIFGYSRAEVEGKKINMLMPEPYTSEHESYIARYEATGERRAIGRIRTVEARRKNGEVFPIELSVTEVAAEGDVRYAAFIRDISEKAKLQEKVIESERLAAVGAVSAAFAHEIGNPLNGMSMTVQLLERRLAKMSGMDEAADSTVQKLKDEIRRLTGLLQDFGSFARRESYRLKPVSLAAVIGDVFAMEAESYNDQGIHVEQLFPSDLPLVLADRDKLKQAMLNLCKNAVEAMPGGGRLTVRAYVSRGDVMLEVTDTGAGIPQGVDIFAPFTTTKAAGTGLGLMIVRRIVAGHGGSISYSTEPGKGTTFRISLPKAIV